MVREKFFPNNKEDISEKVREANRKNFAVIPMGKGSIVKKLISSELDSGVFISTEKMDSILEFEKDNLSVTVQAGTTLEKLQKKLEDYNMFLPLPVESHGHRTMGSLVVENAVGYEEYAYGSIKDYILGLEFVTPYGDIVKTGGKTVKNVSGYDFTRMFSRSWGTLGIITAVTLRLKPQVESRKLLLISMQTLQEACNAAQKVMEEKYTITTVKIFHDVTTNCWKLLFQLGGFKETVEDNALKIKNMLANRYEIFEEENISAFWRNYFLNFPLYNENAIRTIFKSSRLFKIASSIDNELISKFNFFEIDVGSGQLLAYTTDQKTIDRLLDKDSTFTLNYEDIKIGTIYRRLKKALDPNNIMFPNNKLTGGEHLG